MVDNRSMTAGAGDDQQVAHSSPPSASIALSGIGGQPLAQYDTPEKGREWWPRFLAALRNSANVRAACTAAGIERKTAYRNRDRYKGFAKAWDEAMEDACDVLEAEAWQRARSTSDLLLIFLLKAHRPGMYRETIKQQHEGGVTLRVVYGSDGTDDPTA